MGEVAGGREVTGNNCYGFLVMQLSLIMKCGIILEIMFFLFRLKSQEMKVGNFGKKTWFNNINPKNDVDQSPVCMCINSFLVLVYHVQFYCQCGYFAE